MPAHPEDSALASRARVLGLFCAQLCRPDGDIVATLTASRLSDLVERIRAHDKAHPRHWGDDARWTAVSPRGRVLLALRPVSVLVISRHPWGFAQDAPGYRQEPVRHTRCRRGFRCWRFPRTQNERRLNALVVDELEPAVRSSRRKLPSSYDDIARPLTPSWKRQHKGRKAWDRR